MSKMHNTLVVLFALLSSSMLSSALQFPQFRLSSSPLSSAAGAAADKSILADKCTFTLLHKQLCPASSRIKSNFVQLNAIIDHPNNLVIDVAARRPIAAHNSYNKLSENEVFSIGGLLGGRNLTIKARDGNDEINFEYDGSKWSSEVLDGQGVGCSAGSWNDEGWECGKGSRDRRLECAFTCEKIDEEDLKEWESEIEL